MPAGALERRVERRGLAEVAPETDETDGGISRGEALDDLRRPVAAPVVDEEDLVGLPDACEDGGNLLVELLESALLVEEGNDDADARLHGVC
ncbi:MAG: hypothetical protein M5U28_53045 [Sandaracinaceae bacterium]|nr:hypothetical protein [Sandaracinaceae bacterium]